MKRFGDDEHPPSSSGYLGPLDWSVATSSHAAVRARSCR
jgi:hypothetical protein